MIYAYADGPLRLVCGAASSRAEFDAFAQTNTAMQHGFTLEEPDFMALMTDPVLSKLKAMPLIMVFDSEMMRSVITGTQKIAVVEPANVIARSVEMKADEIARKKAEVDDARTIAEITGTKDVDRWDPRSEEQIVQQKAMEELGKKLAGILGKKGKADAAGGQESFSGETPEEVAPAETGPALDANGEDIMIAADQLVGTYHKVTVVGAKLADVGPLLADGGISMQRHVTVSRDNITGCWLACLRQIMAEKIVRVLDGAFAIPVEISLQEVTGRGTPVLPEETEEAGAAPETPIRPWNERRDEWLALDDAAKEENRKGWEPAEFICYHTTSERHRNLLQIVPASWFETNNTQFHEVHDITHILPEGSEIVTGWTYRNKRQDDNRLDLDLYYTKKFRQSWDFQLHINGL